MLRASPVHINSSGPAGKVLPLAPSAEGSGVSNTIRPHYVLGPDSAGRWVPASILSIRYKELAVTAAEAGQSATFCLQVASRTKLRRGMVLRDVARSQTPTPTLPGLSSARPEVGEDEYSEIERSECESDDCSCGNGGAVVWELDAEVRSLRLSSAVPVGTEVVVHCVGVKQAARLLRVSESGGEELSDGGGGSTLLDRRWKAQRLCPNASEARLRFRFVHMAEFVRADTPLIFRTPSAGIGVGVVARLIPLEP